MTQILATVTLAAWLYLLLARGAFWRCAERDDWARGKLTEPPAVAIVLPARNEAKYIAATITSLLQRSYPGPMGPDNLVDDGSQ